VHPAVFIGSHIHALKQTGTVMKTAAKCGLGQAAPEPLLSSIDLFGHEYHALIAQRQEEYKRFVEKSSASSDREGASDPVRSIMRRIATSHHYWPNASSL